MDPGQESEAVGNYLRKHPDTAAATSVCNISAGLLTAKSESGKNDLVITGYDLDPGAVAAIQDGRQAFTIDQQQFWRGYVPILLLTHYIKYGLLEANYFLTGPTIVDKSNIERRRGGLAGALDGRLHAADGLADAPGRALRAFPALPSADPRQGRADAPIDARRGDAKGSRGPGGLAGRLRRLAPANRRQTRGSPRHFRRAAHRDG